MGIFGKFKDLVGIEEYDEEDITEEEIESAAAKIERKTIEPRNSYGAAKPENKIQKEAKDMKTSKDARELPLKDQKVMPMNRVSDKTGAFKLVVIEPASFDECPRLVDNLKARKPVIINLVNMDPTVARKIFDFLSGATYALNGNVQKVADYIFVFAPENVDITANIEHKGMDFNSGSNSQSPWR